MGKRTITKARLESVRGTTTSFFEGVLDGTTLVVKRGFTRAGKTTFTDRNGERFPTAAIARSRFDKLFVRGHYDRLATEELEIEDVVHALAPAASEPRLEAEVLAGRDNAASVYADWLQQHDDPRGELAALALAGKTAEVAAFVAANTTRLFGDLDVKVDSELHDFDWSGGFLTGASLKRSQTKLEVLTAQFLALPIARFVTRLRFGLASNESDNDWSDTMRAVTASRQAAQLRSLRFDDYGSAECELSWTPFGDFSGAWPHLPALEELVIRSGGGGDLGELDLPSLRRFTRISGGLSADEIASIVSARWPRLEQLEVWFGSDNYGAEGTVEMIAPLLAGKAPATLVELGLCNAMFTHELIEPLARSELLPRLRVLDLSNGVLRDDDVDVLLAHAPAFAHLARLDLSRNTLDQRTQQIRAALPNAVVVHQRDPDEERYVGVGE